MLPHLREVAHKVDPHQRNLIVNRALAAFLAAYPTAYGRDQKTFETRIAASIRRHEVTGSFSRGNDWRKDKNRGSS